MRTLVCFLLVAVCTAHAQPAAPDRPTSRTLFVQVDYLRVPEGGDAAFLALERELHKPVHRERVRRGLIVDWGLYAVLLAPPDTPYNFAAVTIYDDIAKLAGSYQGILGAARDLNLALERTLAARAIVHTELWEWLEAEYPEGSAGPAGRYLVVNYMDAPPAAANAYLATEREIWQAIHRTRIREGQMTGWALRRLVLPAGAAMGYGFATVDYYGHLGQVTAPFPEALVARAHPAASEADVAAMMARTHAARTIRKAELWERLEGTD